MKYELRISGKHYNELRSHLFSGDNKESVAVALCGSLYLEKRKILLVHKLHLVPNDQCSVREEDLVEWPSHTLDSFLSIAEKKKLSVLKIHSHPTGFPKFSVTDDKSDRNLFNSIFGWIDDVDCHASVVMLPDGELFGRVIQPDLSFQHIDKISIIGDDIFIWENTNKNIINEDHVLRTKQMFGEGTTKLLSSLRVGVVGCSGTGSPTIEQLARLGIGELVLVDPDKVEKKNLNRILNTTLEDAENKRSKVEVLAKAISTFGFGTKVFSLEKNIYNSFEALSLLASCDFIFGCVDSIDGRHLLNQISTFYLIPYMDIGVKIIADGKGGINQVCGNVHYIQPAGGSLKNRGVYTSEELRAVGLQRTNPIAFEEEIKAGYVVNVNVNSPAVISLNMFASSIAVNEFLARIHPFKNENNETSSIIRFSLSDNFIQRESDTLSDPYLQKFVGRGDMLPILNMPELSNGHAI
ncbi:MAG: ThiF family adenylyltransferase [Bacteroidia bacterium]